MCVSVTCCPSHARGLRAYPRGLSAPAGYTGYGYNIQDIPGSIHPQEPENERRCWYQYYFHSERGRAGLAQNRRDFCKLLWRLWSPNWNFDDQTYLQTAASFDNPDFVPVVIHSYRHRFALAPGDPAAEETEQRLTQKPKIDVVTITLVGGADGVAPSGGSAYQADFFTAAHERRVIPDAGHNLPQEAPRDFAKAILSLV
jgi:pimeloyl-ACP methyl ester carboxylesterase